MSNQEAIGEVQGKEVILVRQALLEFDKLTNKEKQELVDLILEALYRRFWKDE